MVFSKAVYLTPWTALALATVVSASASQVWVVDDDGGAGVDFTDIQPAVQAAADGDHLLVADGTYSSFTLHGKGLHVVAEWGASVRCQGGFSIRALATDQVAVVRGIEVFAPTEDGAQVLNNAGQVWIEECELSGEDGEGLWDAPDVHPRGYHGLRVEGSNAVAVQASVLRGGDGSDYSPAPQYHYYDRGGCGLFMHDSSVAVYDCELRGGVGGSVDDDDASWMGAQGGHGLELDAGFLLSSGSVFVGGQGGISGEDYDYLFGCGYCCEDGGPGGWGIWQESWQTGPADVHLLDCSLQGGPGGPPFEASGCAYGVPGGAAGVPNGTLHQLPGDSCGHVAFSPAREGDPVQLRFTGPAGSVVVLLLAPAPGFTHHAGFSGVFVTDLLGLSLWTMGVIPPGDALLVQVPNGMQVPAGQAVALFGQAACLAPGAAGFVLGGGSELLVLDQSF